MYSTLFSITLVFALAVLRVRADFTVYTPVLTQCKPATLSWDPANGPYDVVIVPASDTCGDSIVDFGDAISDTTYQWQSVAIPSGTEVVISVLDSQGQEGWSGIITVQPSDDSSCLTSQPNPPPASTPTPQAPAPHTPTPSPPTSSSSSTSPSATVVGAANNGLMGNGGSVVRFSGVGIVFTALAALAALL